MNTIGEWLGRRESGAERAWESLLLLFREVGPGVASRTGAPQAFVREDATQEALANLLEDDRPLRRADPSACLKSFLWGYLENVTNRLREGMLRVRTCADNSPACVTATEGSILPLGLLTPAQRSAVIGLREGKNLAQISRSLGISRTAARERLERAWAKIESHRGKAAAKRYPRRRKWVLPAVRACLERGDLENADLLVLFATGASYREIGARRGFTREAVRCRVRRMRRRLKPE